MTKRDIYSQIPCENSTSIFNSKRSEDEVESEDSSDTDDYKPSKETKRKCFFLKKKLKPRIKKKEEAASNSSELMKTDKKTKPDPLKVVILPSMLANRQVI